MTPDLLLDVRNLSVELGSRDAPLRVVDDISFAVGRGEIVGVVGESGCGKSMTAFSILDLFPSRTLRIASGKILFAGTDIRSMTTDRRRDLRGREIGMIFQDPSSFLDPLMRVGHQIGQTLRAHGQTQGVDARVRELLELSELPNPAAVARQYPHELSGGMRQRVLIAAALAMNPSLLIADEPTTALDVTVQAGILRLLIRLRDELGLSLLLITHDLGVIAESCDRVYVMYAGRMVESADVFSIFDAPRHPYTQGLMKSTLPFSDRSEPLFSIPGRVPNPRAWPSGCRFNPRCPIALAEPCTVREPALLMRENGSADACWLSDDVAAEDAWRNWESA
jgi:oligopeptide/dipeptide ABC transporter ATP-binding protein